MKHRRELYSAKAPVERSVSPMFGGRDEASLDNGKVVEEEKVGQGVPHENYNEEESFYTRGELNEEEFIRKNAVPSCTEPNRGEHIR